jgi:hypothetical protein
MQRQISSSRQSAVSGVRMSWVMIIMFIILAQHGSADAQQLQARSLPECLLCHVMLPAVSGRADHADLNFLLVHLRHEAGVGLTTCIIVAIRTRTQLAPVPTNMECKSHTFAGWPGCGAVSVHLAAADDYECCGCRRPLPGGNPPR